jgi:uncharacterized protein YecE (DUF72 family)
MVCPGGTEKKDYLPLYAECFNMVKLDYTYYFMPKTANLTKMLVDSGPNLTFAMKAYQTLTHNIDLGIWKEQAEKYREAIEPVLQARWLEAVLFQFPYSFYYINDNRHYLRDVLACFQGVSLVVESRVADCYTSRVIESVEKWGCL